MNTQTASPNKIDRFLQFLDRRSERLGMNISQLVNIEALRELPEGTFGKAIANFLDSHNLKPFTTGTRRKQLHDSVHVLTGYTSDPIGEAEVQAFLLGSKITLLNSFIGLGTLRLSLKTRQEYDLTPQQILNRIFQAYQRSKKANFDPDQWQPETQWDWPLEKVRNYYQV